MKKLPVIIAFVIVFVITGCTDNSIKPDDVLMSSPAAEFNQEVEIIDAFCEYDEESSYFYFHFTLQNSGDESIEVSYNWTLNDPKADFPGSQEGLNDPLARIYQGQGSVSLAASGTSDFKIKIEETREYDPRFYVMYVSVYREGLLAGYYREQKSTYDWEYGVTPPVKETTDAEQWDNGRQFVKYIIDLLLVDGGWAGGEDVLRGQMIPELVYYENQVYKNSGGVVAQEKAPQNISYIGRGFHDSQPVEGVSSNKESLNGYEVYTIRGISQNEAVAVKLLLVGSEGACYVYYKYVSE